MAHTCACLQVGAAAAAPGVGGRCVVTSVARSTAVAADTTTTAAGQR
jgi:hypothetical protein